MEGAECVHVALGLLTIWFIWRRKDYRRWQELLPTMQYIALGNLTYNFLCANHWLWKLGPDFLSNHSLTEMIYTFITFPGTALMFLAHYPEQAGWERKVGHILYWIVLYVGFELILLIRKNILYGYGWNLGWSALFDCLMFPMLRLHQKKPLLTYVLSVPITFFWLWLFDIPVHVPIEQR